MVSFEKRITITAMLDAAAGGFIGAAIAKGGSGSLTAAGIVVGSVSNSIRLHTLMHLRRRLPQSPDRDQ